MPAYEPGGHQASDSLYDQVTSATQVIRMGAKTSVKAVQGVAGAVGGTAAHTYQGIRTVVGRVKYGKPLGPKMTFKGRVSRRVFLLRKGLKESPRSMLKGVGTGLRRSPGAYGKGVSNAVGASMHGMESGADDELTRLSASSSRLVSQAPRAGVKTIRSGAKALRKAHGSVRRAQLAAKQLKYARSTMQTVKAVARMVASGLSGIGLALLPLAGIIVALIAAIGLLMSFFSGQSGCDAGNAVAAGGFGATSGKLEGLKTTRVRGVTAVDYQALGIKPSWFEDDTSAYQFQQCTWWVANRWKMLGLHVDHHMGNGVDWAASAKRHGYPTGDTPRLGAIVSMSGGVLGASAGPYGHVAVVEQIDSDGSIWVSESGTGFFNTYGAPVVDQYSKAALDAARGKYTYVYSTGSDPSTPAGTSDTSEVSYASMGCPVGDGSGNTGAASADAKTAQEYAKKTMKEQYGWGDDEYQALLKLWNKESGWNYKAENKSSGAYGIPQSLPGNKMATMGVDWRMNYQTQINWGLKYIRDRYGTPSRAWAHNQQTNWY